MTAIERRLHFPAALGQAMATYADAIIRGDTEAGLLWVGPSALETHREAFERAQRMQPFDGFEVIARARLGFQYIMKVRFHGAEHEMTLQCRWREENGGGWRVAELDDVGLRSPWLKPESETPRTRTADG
jgi:hypothetical protein